MPDFGMEVSGGCINDDDLAATPRRSKRRIEREARGPGRRGGEEERAGEGSLERMGFGGRKKRVSGGAGGGGSLGVVRGTSGSYVTSVRTHSRDFSDRGMDTSDTTIDTGVFVTLEDIASQEQQQESRRRRSSDGSNESSTVMVPTGKTSHSV